MTRLPDWPERLDRLVEDARHRTFSWGLFDCCLFAADAVSAVTGIDPAASWRGAYAGARAAAGLLARMGGLDATAAGIARHHGWPRVPPAFLGRGDVALVRLEDDRHALAVCLGAALVLPAQRGLAALDRNHALSGWRIS
ncbi:hypothetical protein GE253_23995 [Niveispirillum sp. SYP-B3756]|uniref:DUF6950 family protein n=1 Tax=Niveispirillum sp. SYP-B3756 TaxID=2662178 RepID=UPI0012924051|nr:hypothetical protein [Niveispirillum sp. SYP-B3756]MQP68386.1 hypothetical protein [Niveispirillum sp. SYP-B3756]